MDTEPGKVGPYERVLGKRHIQFGLYFVITVIGYGMRTNMSVGIIAMMSESPPAADVPTYPEWTQKSLILSAFFWGYVVPQVGAGQLARRFGPKWFLAVAMLLTSVFSILMAPMAQRYGEAGVIACRVAQGLTQGFLFPSTHALLGKWTPLEERSRVASFVYTGGPLGTVISMPLTGLISSSRWGWPAAFRLYGALGLGWVALWCLLGSNSPAEHGSISEAERRYIAGPGGAGKGPRPTPWLAIVTSPPLWAILVAHAGQNWGFWTLLTEIPSYMEGILRMKIEENSLLSALPYLALWALNFVFSYVADFLIVRRGWAIGATRKLFNTIGLVIPAMALLLLGCLGSEQRGLAVLLLVVAVGFNAAVYCGFNVNHIDISPNHAGTLMGITNGLSNTVSILAPLAVQAFGRSESDPALWQMVFSTAAVVYIVTDLFYVIFASGQIQEWNN